MKKLLALLLALCALFTFAMAETETAEETETLPEVKWEDISPLIDTSLGQFIPIGSLPYVFWSPDPFDWEAAEEEGTLECYAAMGETADGTSYTIRVAVLDPATYSEEFMDSYAEIAEDWTDYDKGLINGMKAATFYVTDGDITQACFVIWPDEATAVMMSAVPFLADDLGLLFSAMCASVQPAQ